MYCNCQADPVEETSKWELTHIAFFKGGDGAGHITCVHRTAGGKWQHCDGLEVSTTTVTFSEEGFVIGVLGEHPKEHLSNVYWVVYESNTVDPKVAIPLTAEHQRLREVQSNMWRSKIRDEHDAEKQSHRANHEKVLRSLSYLHEVTHSNRLSE